MNLSHLKPENFTGLFFDFDGTIRHNDPPALEIFYRIAAELGVETDHQLRRDGEKWVNAYWADSLELREDLDRFGAWQDNGPFWVNHGYRHLVAIGVQEKTAIELAPEITLRMRSEYEPQDCVEDDVVPTLEALREAGFRLAIISNRSQPFRERVETLGLAEHFDLILAAGEVGWYKPDPRILRHAAAQFQLPPERVLYIGDNYQADIVGAREAGMTAVLYDPRDLYQEIEGIRIRSMGELQEWVNGLAV
jgi:HAD superfamily hydrolase (TIGR01549 family)